MVYWLYAVAHAVNRSGAGSTVVPVFPYGIFGYVARWYVWLAAFVLVPCLRSVYLLCSSVYLSTWLSTVPVSFRVCVAVLC